VKSLLAGMILNQIVIPNVIKMETDITLKHVEVMIVKMIRLRMRMLPTFTPEMTMKTPKFYAEMGLITIVTGI
jgi:hypothetical protein